MAGQRRPPAAGSPARDLSLAGLRFLVVDDNPLTRELLCDGLRHGGSAALSEAATATDAMAILASSKIDAVIVNADLAEASGLGFVRRLRTDTNPRIAGLPCLIVSGSYREDLESQQGPAGFALYVARRFAADRLCRHVLRAMAARADALGIESWLGLDRPESRNLVPKPRLRRGLLDILTDKLRPRARGRKSKIRSEDEK